jgi:hypothetical protein
VFILFYPRSVQVSIRGQPRPLVVFAALSACQLLAKSVESDALLFSGRYGMVKFLAFNLIKHIYIYICLTSFLSDLKLTGNKLAREEDCN